MAFSKMTTTAHYVDMQLHPHRYMRNVTPEPSFANEQKFLQQEAAKIIEYELANPKHDHVSYHLDVQLHPQRYLRNVTPEPSFAEEQKVLQREARRIIERRLAISTPSYCNSYEAVSQERRSALGPGMKKDATTKTAEQRPALTRSGIARAAKLRRASRAKKNVPMQRLKD